MASSEFTTGMPAAWQAVSVTLVQSGLGVGLTVSGVGPVVALACMHADVDVDDCSRRLLI